MKFINYGRQWIDQSDIDAVIEVLNSDFITQGPKVTAFEEAICQQTGAKYCVAVSNGTAALHLAVAALKIPEGKRGITTPITFLATANAMLYSKLKPSFADIDSKSYLMTPETVAKEMSDDVALLLPVHLAGNVCDMDSFVKFARQQKQKVAIIEDAAHALGSRYADGSYVGNCRFSEMTIFSFHPVKTITCGEGGAITTNSKDLYDTLRALRNHGVERDPQKMTQNPGPWYHEMQQLGFNYRMTDMQAALGINQLSKLESFSSRRATIVKQYNEEFANLSWLRTPQNSNNATYHLYVARIDYNAIGKSRCEVMEELRSSQIGTQVHYIPVHTQPYYRKNFNFCYGDFPHAENYYEEALSLPLYPSMSDFEVKYVIEKIKDLT